MVHRCIEVHVRTRRHRQPVQCELMRASEDTEDARHVIEEARPSSERAIRTGVIHDAHHLIAGHPHQIRLASYHLVCLVMRRHRDVHVDACPEALRRRVSPVARCRDLRFRLRRAEEKVVRFYLARR